MQIQAAPEVLQLFGDVHAPILATPKPKRMSAPPKSRPSSVPSRRSAWQVATNSTIPVSQREALHLAQELGKLDPNDKMTLEAAARLIKCFDEPLSETDILTIARLRNLDVTALKIAAGV